MYARLGFSLGRSQASQSPPHLSLQIHKAGILTNHGGEKAPNSWSQKHFYHHKVILFVYLQISSRPSRAIKITKRQVNKMGGFPG